MSGFQCGESGPNGPFCDQLSNLLALKSPAFTSKRYVIALSRHQGCRFATTFARTSLVTYADRDTFMEYALFFFRNPPFRIAARDCRTVYKVKKPVKLPFLDFSNVELRHHFCEEEARINRPWAPDVYLGVVTVTQEATGFRFEGNGPVVAWRYLDS